MGAGRQDVGHDQQGNPQARRRDEFSQRGGYLSRLVSHFLFLWMRTCVVPLSLKTPGRSHASFRADTAHGSQ